MYFHYLVICQIAIFLYLVPSKVGLTNLLETVLSDQIIHAHPKDPQIYSKDGNNGLIRYNLQILKLCL